LFADLASRAVLVVGGGEVAARKVESLLAAGADVTVGAPVLNDALAQALADGRIRHRVGEFDERWLDEVWLVIAATSDADVNHAVAAAATSRRLLANVVDDAALSSFHVPAIVDRSNGDFPVFESGAIMLYLAERAGRLIPADEKGRSRVVQWLMFQMGGLGPMLGQAHHFRIYAPEKIEYAVNRYTNEAKRLYGVMDKQLGKTQYLASDEYTIADIASFPWTRSWQNQGIELAEFPNVKRWHEAIAARPAVQRGVEVLASARRALTDDKARDILFGATQYAKH